MKRVICSIALVLILSGCSMNDVISLLVTPTSPPLPPTAEETLDLEPTDTATPAETGTSTVVPTFTSTPTLVQTGGSIDTQTGDETMALPTLILVPTATSGAKISFNTTGSLIASVSVSSDTLYWGYCDAPKYVDFDVSVVNSPRLGYVLLFLRLVDKQRRQSTGWGAGAIMSKGKSGYYTYRITPQHLTHYNQFPDAWVEYQVVASTGSLKILESSPVYETSLSLEKCLPPELDDNE